jgi:hypothetical protein
MPRSLTWPSAAPAVFVPCFHDPVTLVQFLVLFLVQIRCGFIRVSRSNLLVL